MSIWVSEEITCGRCQTRFAGRVANGLNITRNPDIRQTVLDRTFHVFDCPGCAARVVYEKPFLFTDLSRRQFAVVEPWGNLREWRVAEGLVRELYTRNIEQEPSGLLFPDGVPAFRVRAVYGYPWLREKLLLWDAGLDDALFEALKMQVLGELTDLVARGCFDLCLDTLDDETLRLTATAPGAATVEVVEVPRARFEGLEADRRLFAEQWPELFGSGFVDFRRYVV